MKNSFFNFEGIIHLHKIQNKNKNDLFFVFLSLNINLKRNVMILTILIKENNEFLFKGDYGIEIKSFFSLGRHVIF